MSATADLSNRVPRKAKQVLDKLVGSRSMTQEGMEWLVCATDPFHDDRVRNPGYPDMSTVNSVVQTYTTTTSISAPTGQPSNQTWDLHVPFLPFSPSIVASPLPAGLNSVQLQANGYMPNQGTNFLLYPGFNAISCGTPGTDWYSSSSVSGASNSNIVAIPPKFLSGHARLIGAGLEVVNTTADLYKGGSLTVYRAPSCVEEGIVKDKLAYPSVADAWVPYPVEYISLPPTTQAEAAIYTDSRTWAAEDGCYVVVPQVNIDNPFRTFSPSDVVIKKTLDYQSENDWITAGSSKPAWSSVLVGANRSITSAGTGSHGLPFENVGTILTGLNPNATIQLSVKYFFERIPSTVEADILGMAQVPPAFDGVAMEIYSRCLAQMPVGVPVSENPLGEWFTGILDTVASVAPKIGGFVSNLGNAISMVGNGQASSTSNATPQRKMNNQQKQQQKASLPKGPPPSYAKATGMTKSKAKRLKQKAKTSS